MRTKPAITLHAQVFEIDYSAGYRIADLDAADIDRLRPFGFSFEPATEFIQRRNLALTQAQIRLSRHPGAPEPEAIPGYSCY